MEPFVGTTTTGVSIADGVVQVTVNVNVVGRDDESVASDVENALEAYLGDLPNQFDHVILCLPPGVNDWVAWGKWR